jgi:hypothetical protein
MQMPAGCEEVSVLLALICGSGISTDAVVSPLTHPYPASIRGAQVAFAEKH